MDVGRERIGWPLLLIGVSVGLWSILLSFVEGPVPIVWVLGTLGGVLIGTAGRSFWRERQRGENEPGFVARPWGWTDRRDPPRLTDRFRAAMIMVALFLTFLPLAIGVSEGAYLVLDEFYELSARLIGSGVVIATVGLIARPKSGLPSLA